MAMALALGKIEYIVSKRLKYLEESLSPLHLQISHQRVIPCVTQCPLFLSSLEMQVFLSVVYSVWCLVNPKVMQEAAKKKRLDSGS